MTDPTSSDRASLIRLFAGGDLSRAETASLFARLVRGDLSEAEIVGLLLAFKLKGESAEELIGAASALRAAAAPFPRPDYLFADCCGTGGDNSGTINVSTAVALVAAAAGLPIVKHGNRSISSRCGSADVLEKLDVKIDAPAATMRAALDRTNICFLFAPHYHPGLKHAAAARKTLGVRTILNLMGPCLNPAATPVQLIGVAEEALIEPIATVLAGLGVKRALIVHGAGLDEIALHAPTSCLRLIDGAMERFVIDPAQAALKSSPRERLAGGDPEENAARLRALLDGEGREAENDIVALNAGALLQLAGKAASLREGARLAGETLRSGAAGRTLRAFVEASHG
jgi:anthranilate phosphoribosyltransferase